ncbi:hypothetical protein CSA37_01470 [Candidatus Fermentibacteria bacterium]|nr:MAG: hypothetical protein CSA37_01470 [Candidatus Fermentibacteria bacterium]
MTSSEFFIGVVIASIGPLLLGVGFLYKARQEKIRTRRRAAYLLLEIWNYIAFTCYFPVEKMITDMIELVKQKISFPLPEDENASTDAINKITPIMTSHILEQQIECVNRYEKLYMEAIDLMSYTDPMLAFSISSAGNVRKNLERSKAQLEEMGEDSVDDDLLNDFLGQFKAGVTENVTHDALDSLEDEISELTGKIGPLIHRKCKKLFKDSKVDVTREKEYRETLEKATEEIVQVLLVTLTNIVQRIPNGEASLEKLQSKDST